MISNRRQTLPLLVVLLMVMSVFAFTPVSAAASLTASLEAHHDVGDTHYSFASVNGSADYTVTITNDGDAEFGEVTVSASFLDDTWLSENVTFTASGVEGNGTISLGSLGPQAMIQVQVSATVGQGVKVASSEVPMTLSVDADGNSVDLEAIIVVTNWIAYESNFPGQPAINTYTPLGQNYSYQIIVENIAVNENQDIMPIADTITISDTSSLGEWFVSSDDTAWENMAESGTLNGMDPGASYTWNVIVNLTGNLRAGNDHVIGLQASSTSDDDGGGGGPGGGGPGGGGGTSYVQPYGMTSIPVGVAASYGVGVSGANSQNVNLSEGSAIATWDVEIDNLGNIEDTFDIDWDNNGILPGWSISSQPDTSGEVAWQGTMPFSISLSVPVDALAGASSSFTMTVNSTNSPSANATQAFVLTVDQHYGVSLSVDSDSKSGAPSGIVDFLFIVTNDGNGEDAFGITVEGPTIWNPSASASNITLSAGSSGQFTVSVTVPSTSAAGAVGGPITVTVSSSNGETDTVLVNVSTSQVYSLSVDYGTDFDGTVNVTQEVQLQMKLDITNNGNGPDNVTLTMTNQPLWATFGDGTSSTTHNIARGQTVEIVIVLSPDAAALAGRDYTFQIVATSEDDLTTKTSSDLKALIGVVETTNNTEPEKENIEEDEGSLPGLGFFASLLAMTFVALSRRKD